MSRFEAEIVLDYGDSRVAEAVAAAVSPDNLKTPAGMAVDTVRSGGRVLTRVCCGTLSTFIATVDDLLFCTSVAEGTLQAAKKKG